MENASSTPAPAPAQSEANDLAAQVVQLRKIVSSMLILLVVLSVTLNAVLTYQYWLASAAVKEFRPQAAALMAEYNQIGPRMDQFINQIRQYGNTHPDFGPIMAKYGLVTNAVQAVPSAPVQK